MTSVDSQRENTSSREFATELLLAVQGGSKKAVDQLLPLLYEEMRSMAHEKLRYERQNHTIDTTALVHEAYLKLIDQKKTEWQSRAHFLAVAALAMRRILVNYAQKRNAVKRGSDFSRVEWNDIADIPESIDEFAEEILALNNELKRLEHFNSRGSRVIEYHFFGGLTWDEISEVMGIAPVTARRSWYMAKLWLNRELGNRGFTAVSDL